MTKNEDRIQDWRSTGRRKGRRTLYNAYRDYKCEGYEGFECGKTTKSPPKDAPSWFEDIWPEDNRVLESQLQVDHTSKDLTNNSEEFLEWACPSCHKIKDSKTAKGVATVVEEFW
jgi:hypothetical protein